MLAFVLCIGLSVLAPASDALVYAQGPAQVMQTNPNKAANTETPEFGCFDGGGGSILWGCMAWASYGIMSLMAWFAGGAAILLNFAVAELVVGMGQLVGEMPGVVDAWIVIRDLTNVFLVFLTIFIGLAMIMGISSYGDKSLLFKVILAAIFVNFSMLFTKVVIDVSNLAATEIYTLLITQARPDLDGSACGQQVAAANFTDSKCIGDGLAGAWWGQLKLISIFSFTNATPGATEDMQKRIMYIGALGSILFAVMTFIFGAAALLLIGRFVKLVFLLIISPVTFVMWVTKITGHGRWWWKELLSQSFFAPAMFLMFWISWKLTTSLSARYFASNDLTSLSGAATGNIGAMALILYFVLVVGFLIASLIVAKNMGAAGAAVMMKTGSDIAKTAGMGFGAGVMAPVGAAAYTMRRGVGATTELAEAKFKNSKFARTKVGTFFGESFVKPTADKVKSASFDPRGTKLVQGLSQGYLGEAKKGGYTGWKKEMAEKQNAYEKWLAAPTPTGEDNRKRDLKQEQVDDAHKASEQMGLQAARDAEAAALEAEHADETAKLEVEGKLTDTLGHLDSTIGNLNKEISKETDPEKIKEKQSDLVAAEVMKKRVLTSQGALGRIKASNTELGALHKQREKNWSRMSAAERTAHTQRVEELTTQKHADMTDMATNLRVINYARAQERDPQIAQVQRTLSQLQAELGRTQDMNAKAQIQQRIGEEKAHLEARKKAHTQRLEMISANPMLKDDEVAEKMAEKKLEARKKIDHDYAQALKDAGAKRKDQVVDRLASDTNFGLPLAQWKREYVAQERLSRGKSKEQRQGEEIAKILEQMKKQQEKDTGSA